MPRIERQQYSLPSLKNPTAARWDFSMVEPQPPPRRGAQNARHRTGLQRAALPPSHRQQSAGSRPFSHPLLLLTVSSLYRPCITPPKTKNPTAVRWDFSITETQLPSPRPRRAKRAPQKTGLQKQHFPLHTANKAPAAAPFPIPSFFSLYRPCITPPKAKNPTAVRWDFSMVEPQPPSPRRGAQNARRRTGFQRVCDPLAGVQRAEPSGYWWLSPVV